jgi:hypothetical protein
MPTQIDPEQAVARLAAQVGKLFAELTMRDLALEAAERRIAELEALGKPPGSVKAA